MKGMLTSDTHAGFSKRTIEVHEGEFLPLAQKTIEEQKIEVFFHAGDWASNKQDQLYRTLKLFRKYISIPIVTVFGNHDFWEYDRFRRLRGGWEAEQRRRLEWCKEFNIHYLGEGPAVFGDVLVLGFDGWYNYTNPPTKDTDSDLMHPYIQSAPSMVYLQNRAYKELDKLLQHDTDAYRKVIGMSHFPPFTEDSKYEVFCANLKYFQPLKEKCDVLLFGHSHKEVDRVEDDCHILNCGSHYDKPKFKIFEV